MRRLKDEKYVLAFSNSMYHKFPQLRTYGSKYYCYANYQGLQKNFSYCDALNKLIDYKLIEILDQKIYLMYHQFCNTRIGALER
jgi:hypothetical protein